MQYEIEAFFRLLFKLLCLSAALAWTGLSFGIDYANGFNIKGALVPEDEIVGGGPPRDGIPALFNPRFVSPAEVQFLKPDDRVLGVSLNGVAKAYPERIMIWHEIVNDDFNGKPVVVSFCPLCGTGEAHFAKLDGKRLSFGVSGLLYNSNLLLYDKQTESLWSQLLGKAITGPMKGSVLKGLPVVHTVWEAWKKVHPDTLVLSDKTGFERNYSYNPYSDYLSNAVVMFRVNRESHRFHPKEWVLGVEANGKYKAYPFTELAKADYLVRDTVAGKTLEIRLDPATRSAQAFTAGKLYPSQTVYWFAWFAFHPETDTYQAPPAHR